MNPDETMEVPPVLETAAFSYLGMFLTHYFKCIIHLSYNNEEHLLAENMHDDVLLTRIMNARLP